MPRTGIIFQTDLVSVEDTFTHVPLLTVMNKFAEDIKEFFEKNPDIIPHTNLRAGVIRTEPMGAEDGYPDLPMYVAYGLATFDIEQSVTREQALALAEAVGQDDVLRHYNNLSIRPFKHGEFTPRFQKSAEASSSETLSTSDSQETPSANETSQAPKSLF